MRTILLLAVYVLISTTAKSGNYIQTFESTRLTTLVADSGWASTSVMDYTGGLMIGNHAIMTPALSNPASNVHLLTPSLIGSGINNFTFSHRIQPSNTSNVKLYIQIYNNSNQLIKLDSVVYSGSNLQSKLVTFNYTGNYKINFKWVGNGGSTNAYLDNILVNSALVPLPVKLINFNALSLNKKNEIKWESSYEELGKYEVCRSLDGRNYEVIGKVNTLNNTSGLNSYSFIDYGVSALNAGMIYYKLKMSDMNGSFTWSNISAVKTDSKNPVTINAYPNPATDILNIHINGNSENEFTISISDFNGKEIKNLSSSDLHFGAISLDLNGYGQGLYFIAVKSSDGSFSSVKFLKK